MDIATEDDASFEKVRERWTRLRHGDELRFTVLRAGHVSPLRTVVP